MSRDDSDSISIRSASVTNNTNVTLQNHFPPVPSLETQKQFEKMLSLWVYNRNLPFSIFDTQFEEVISFIRPGVKIPTAETIGGKNLLDTYETIQLNLHQYLQNTPEFITLGCDSWTDTNGDPIINYIAMNQHQLYLINSINSGDASHTADYFIEQTIQIIDKYPEKYVGMVTDNTSTNKCMWNGLKARYPNKYFYGCAAHVYHLLVKDIFILPSTFRKESSTPFPLQNYVNLEKQCSEIVNVLNKGLQRQYLKRLQGIHKLRSLKIHGETRWGTLLRMFTEIQNWKDPILFPLFGDPEWRNKGTEKLCQWKTEMRDVIHSEVFENTLKYSIAILSEINVRLNKCQSDFIKVSDVYHDFQTLKTAINEINFPQQEKHYILNLVQKRWNFLNSDCHRLAYYLDPKYFGECMSVPDKMQTQDDIIEGIVRNEQSALGNNERSIQKRKSEICNELTIFRNNVVQYRQSILLASQSPHWSALTWWQEFSLNFPIVSVFAIKLFSLVVSTSSVERSFKTRGSIHTKTRNRLSHEKCTMLMSIKMNYGVLSKTHQSNKRKFNEMKDNVIEDIIELESDEDIQGPGDEQVDENDDLDEMSDREHENSLDTY